MWSFVKKEIHHLFKLAKCSLRSHFTHNIIVFFGELWGVFIAFPDIPGQFGIGNLNYNMNSFVFLSACLQTHTHILTWSLYFYIPSFKRLLRAALCCINHIFSHCGRAWLNLYFDYLSLLYGSPFYNFKYFSLLSETQNGRLELTYEVKNTFFIYCMIL